MASVRKPFGSMRNNAVGRTVTTALKYCAMLLRYLDRLSIVFFVLFFKWLKWSQLLGAEDDSPGAYIVSYLFYVIWALSFAGLAAVLVRMFAPYASGGGIPEVTCTCREGGLGFHYNPSAFFISD